MNRILLALLVFCAAHNAWAEKTLVSVSVHPLALVVEALAGDSIDVYTVLKGNSDPHTAQLSVSQAAEVMKSSVLLSYKGVELNEKLRRMDVPYREFGKTDHSWLSPDSVLLDAESVSRELCARIPVTCAAMPARLEALRSIVAAAMSDCRLLTAQFTGKATLLVGTHPAWKVFAQTLGFENADSLFELRSETVLPKTLARVQNRAAAAGKILFIADPDTPKGLQQVFTNDFKGVVKVLDENGGSATSLGDFYRGICKAISDGLA